jgi:hypothetical protein
VYAPAPDRHAFFGSCSVQGTVSFRPPATNTAQFLTYDYPATGKCSGHLDGQSLSNAPVHLRQVGRSFGTCSSARTTTPGHGVLSFDNRDARMAYTLDFSSLATEVSFTLYGDRAGTASAQGTFLTTRTPPGVVLNCARSGARHVPMDMTAKTQTALVG